MSDVIKNMIAKNKRAIFDVEAIVQFNVGQIQVARSTIEENITDAQQSYLVNAGGNLELIMRTTDDVFRNRLMMIEQLNPTNTDQEAFQLSMANRVKVEYLDHRSKIVFITQGFVLSRHARCAVIQVANTQVFTA